jgi:cell division transport system permease protein
MLSRIEFFIMETAVSLRRHPAMALAAILCVAAALFVTGIVALALLNANTLIDNSLGKVRFMVYFKMSASRAQTVDAFRRIREIPQVEAAKTIMVFKEDALAEWKAKDPVLLQDVPGNPFPDKVIVKAKSAKDITSLKKMIMKWQSVESTYGDPAITAKLIGIQNHIRNVGLIVGVLLIILSLVIIHHAIELTLYARKREIHIMSLVGATPSTIAFPFLLEGVVYGLVGGGIALAGLEVLYYFMRVYVSTNLKYNLQWDSSLQVNGAIFILSAGVALGLIGSIGSAIKYVSRPKSPITNA